MSSSSRPFAPHPGAPLVPTGNPMLDGLGPAAWADRPDVPDATVDGHPKMRPLSAVPAFSLDPRDPDPRGMPVYGTDRVLAGMVVDVWVNTSEPTLVYLEVDLGTPGRRLLPAGFTQIDGNRRVIRVMAILAHQFADVPVTRAPDVVTLLEEDKIAAYYAGGYLYATPGRSEPIV